MDDDHLLNTISMLQRVAEAHRASRTVFYTLCEGPQGDMAQDCFDREFDMVMDSTWQDYVLDIYWDMEAEAERRGLALKPEKSAMMWELDYIAQHIEAKR